MRRCWRRAHCCKSACIYSGDAQNFAQFEELGATAGFLERFETRLTVMNLAYRTIKDVYKRTMLSFIDFMYRCSESVGLNAVAALLQPPKASDIVCPSNLSANTSLQRIITSSSTKSVSYDETLVPLWLNRWPCIYRNL